MTEDYTALVAELLEVVRLASCIDLDSGSDHDLLLMETVVAAAHRATKNGRVDEAADAIASLERQLAELRQAIAGKDRRMLPTVTHGQYLEMAQALQAACDGSLERAQHIERQLAELPSQALWDESRKALASMRNENGELSPRATTAEAERDRLAARCEELERALVEIHAIAMLAEGNATLSRCSRTARAALQEPQT